jgi:hypothetical protein|tara:strand:- start:765 stop:866 length:102 start_codon:yes stop_codon:yes gene_type:complete
MSKKIEDMTEEERKIWKEKIRRVKANLEHPTGV